LHSTRIQVSAAGGRQPRWRRDGKELFFISPGSRLMATPIQISPALSVGTPAALFPVQIPPGAGIGSLANYDVSADGQRFITARRIEDACGPLPARGRFELDLRTREVAVPFHEALFDAVVADGFPDHMG